MKKLLTFFLTALLAFGVGWAAVENDVLTAELLGLGGSYADFTGKTATTNAVYAGNAMKNSANAIQLRSSNSNSGIVTTGSGGKARSITVAWNSSTASGRTLNVYGKNSAYSAATDLYGSNSGTLLGTIVCGTSTSLSISGDYEYIGFRSAGSAMYLTSVTIAWETGSTAETCASPEFSLPAGTYFGTQSVTIACDTQGASIYYTTDGSDPSSTNGTLYSGPVTIESSTTLKAIAIKTDYNDSGITSAYYNIIPGSSVFRKVTSVNQLVKDRKYILVYPGTLANHSEIGVMGPRVGTNNYYSFVTDNNLAITDNEIDIAGYDAVIMTLGGSTGAWTLKVDDSNYLSWGGSSTYLTTSNDPSLSNAQWAANSDQTGYWMTNVGSVNSGSSRSVIANVDANPLRFACYTNTNSTQGYALLFYQYDGTDPATLSVSTNTLPIGNNGDSFEVYGDNLTQGLTVAASSNFNASPNYIAADANYPATVNVTYTGQALGATGTVTVSNTSDNLSETVNVNYAYDGDIYIVGDINNTNWSFSNCTQMTREGGVYTAYVTAQAGGEYEGINRSWFYFTKSIGDENTVVANAFGPAGTGGRWWMNPEWYGEPLALDVNGNLNTIYMNPGSYQIVVNPANNTFSVTPYVANPVITPATGNYYEAQTVSIDCATPGATIYYTTDGNDPTTSSAVYNGAFTINETTTVKAIAVSNGMTSQMATSVINIQIADFVLVTSVDDLAAGNEVIIVNRGSEGAGKAMSTTQNANNRGETDVTVTSNNKVFATETTQIAVLEHDADGWYFKVGDDGYLTAPGTSNYLRTTSTKSDGEASISISGSGEATIQLAPSNRYLRHNNSSHIFSTYSSGQQPVYLYKRGEAQPHVVVTPANSLDLGTIPAGGTQTSATFTVQGFNLNANDVVTLSIDAPYFTVNPTAISAADAMAGAVTVTVTYAGPDNNASAIVTIGSQNGDFEDVTLNVTAQREAIAVTITPADGSTFMGSTVNGIIEANVAGATIEYSFDGINWMTYDPDEGFSATVDYVGGEVTVYARARYNGETSAVAHATYTRVGKAATCSADIVFAPNVDNDEITSWAELHGYISEGDDYVSSANMTVLYTSLGYSALRFGSRNNVGNLSLTLDLTKFEGGACKLTSVKILAAKYGTDGNSALKVTTNVDTDGETKAITASQDNFAEYVFNFGGDEIESLTIANTSSNGRVYVKSISLEYNCGSAVEAPEIVPGSGTYYDDLTVSINGDGNSTIYYTTDGSDPLTSETHQEYTGSFSADYVPGGTTVIKAVAIDDEDNVSEMTTVTYAWGVPTVSIIPGSTNVTEQTTIPVTITDLGAADAVIYYTTDGSTPNENSTVYTGSFDVTLADVGDEVTVKAIVVSEGYTSSVATATYKYVENTIEMIDPYFSPICNHTYYGDQTVEILCPIPGAIMYYEIAEANGTTAPSANEVAQPSRGSSQYGEPIALTVGKSYYIKAVAYVGNNVSNIIEGWYIIRPTSEWTGPNARVLESVSDLQSVSSGTTVTFRNPVQVVYMSKFTNDPTPTGYNNPIPEFCYVRDNTGYGLIYFGKAATEWAQQTDGRTNSPATFYNMGDWVDGSQIVGETGTWSSGLIPQLGTNSHVITSWPGQAIGHTRIMAEPTTCAEINAANTVENNLCGHYVHLRNTTIDWAEDQKPTGNDPDYRNFGRYTDGTAMASMYDRFWLFSGTQTYTFNDHDYTMKGVGDYNTAFFNYYQDKGATFDIFAIGAYYTGNFTHDGVTEKVESEILPIDYLWIYPPTIQPQAGQYEGEVTLTIEGDTASWSNNEPTIYYRTDEMEDWAVYDPQNPPVITSSTTVYTYTELPAVKTDGTDYSDFVRSDVVSATYTIIGIDDPVISPESQLVDISDGPQTLQVTVTTGEGCTSTEGTYYTVYTTDGSTPYWNNADDYNGTIIEGTAGANGSFVISETTTVTAVTYYVLDGEVELVSNIKSETYTFVKKNGVTYNILTDAPQVGTIVVIVNKAHNMAMSTTQNETNRGSVGVLFTDNTKDVVYGNDEIAQFVVESAGTNRYYLKNVNGGTPGYLYVNSNSANLLTESTLDNEGKAVSNITIGAASDNVDERYIATVTFAYEGTTRYLRYYDNGHAFSTYSDGSLHEDVFLYGIEATPLSFIEENKHQGDHVVVSDQLVGAWAVEDGNTKLLWVKDQGNRSIIPTYNDLNAIDYMMDYCRSNPQKTPWDQSNWAIIDFSNQTVRPTDYVNKVIQGSTIVGTYTDELNYTIVLDATSEGGVEPVIVGEAEGYYGYLEAAHGDPLEIQYNDYSYNHYTTVNFLEKNLNEPWGPGAKAGENARAAEPGTPMFFMNPKIMEVAHVWGVYDGLHGNYHRFDIYENVGSNNGFDLEGSFDVLSWDYNRMDDDNYGMPEDLVEGKAYMFHVVVARENFQYGYRAANMMRGAGTAESASSNSMGAYPLDLPRGGGAITAVKDVKGAKEVESVRFYNLMGVESMTPFEGINIEVTRYTDGSMTSRKVMR